MPIKLIEQIYKDSQLLTAKSGDFKRVTHSYLQTLIALRFNQQNKNIFIVLPNLYEAQKYYDNLSNLLDPSLRAHTVGVEPEIAQQVDHDGRAVLARRRERQAGQGAHLRPLAVRGAG